MFDNLTIVLVEPQHPGNIGAVARAMKNMGLGNLALVNPKRFPDPQAEWRAAGAIDLLEKAVCYDSVHEAIKGCHVVIGTSARSRNIPWPSLVLRELPEQFKSYPADQKIAILFGREDSGLTNEELQFCQLHMQIPSHEDYPALNLAMAVQVVGYELFASKEKSNQPKGEWDRRLASSGEVELMLEHFENVLLETDFLNEANPGKTMVRLRRMFSRIGLDDTEVQILRGILKHMDPRSNVSKNSVDQS